MEVINVVKLDPNIFFLCMAASVADVAAVNPNGIKKVLANGLSTFPINGNPVFNDGPKIILKILPIVEFYVTEFLIILYLLKNYLKKVYEALELKNCVENYFRHYNLR